MTKNVTKIMMVLVVSLGAVFFAGCQGGKRIVQAKLLGIIYMLDQDFALYFVGNLRQKRPEGGGGFNPDLLLIFIQIIENAVPVVPHQGAYPGLDGKIGLFISIADFFIVENIA